MKRLIQVVPKEGGNLYGKMVAKEVELAKRNRGTFFRSGPKERDRAKWSHSKYKGWIRIARGTGNVVTVEIQSRSDSDDGWQIVQAFIGWLDRHFGDSIQALNIQFHE